jgi:Uma2 family endonuclease
MSTAGTPFTYPPMPLGRPSQFGEPTWEVAAFFPDQGKWSESEYLRLDRSGGKLLELVNGYLVMPTMPTISHQRIALHFYKLLDAFVTARQLGTVVAAPCPVRLGKEHYREPDVFFLSPARIKSLELQPEGADLVMEVVSKDPRDRDRDLKEKPIDYAQAGIPEYWIVDPLEQTITVLVLDGAAYRQDQVCKPGETARSILLPGFEVDVAATFAAGG